MYDFDYLCLGFSNPIQMKYFKIFQGAIILHDCIYQFIRLFYHSRFKPPQLEMTLAQLATPIIDVILVVPLIIKLVQNIAGFSNDAKNRIKSKPGMQKYFTKPRNQWHGCTGCKS